MSRLPRAPPRRSRKPPRPSARADKRPSRSPSTYATWRRCKATIAAQAPFDILVNNAGTNRPAPFVDVKVEDFDFVFSAQRARGLFRGAGGGAPADRGQEARLDHQHVVADGPCRRADPHGLLRDQARDGRLHQGDGDRARAAQDPRQHAGADLHRNADDAAVLREQGVPRGHAAAGSSSAASASSKTSPAQSCFWRATPPR